MPVFRWFYLYTDEHGWRFNIVAFVRGATDNFRHFSMQGVFVVGFYRGKIIFEFCPDTDPIISIGPGE